MGSNPILVATDSPSHYQITIIKMEITKEEKIQALLNRITYEVKINEDGFTHIFRVIRDKEFAELLLDLLEK